MQGKNIARHNKHTDSTPTNIFQCPELGHTCTNCGILQLESTSAPSANDPLANVLGKLGLGEHCIDGVKLALPHFDVKVIPPV